jgi:hypothetical protein
MLPGFLFADNAVKAWGGADPAETKSLAYRRKGPRGGFKTARAAGERFDDHEGIA